MPVVPAMIPLAWRRPSMNRATMIICASVPLEEGGGFIQSFGGEEDVAAVSPGEPAPAEVADRETNVVAY
jgi:hypothetical protein